jgi:hypothetical protein
MNFFKLSIQFLKLLLNYIISAWGEGSILLSDRANIGSGARLTHPPNREISAHTLVRGGSTRILARVAGEPVFYFGVDLFGWKCLGIDYALENAAFQKGDQRC